jgi:hypothetical protein
MQECIICKKTIPHDRELCDNHRNILNSIFEAYDQDPEMRQRWDSVLELIKRKGYAVTGSYDVEDVFKFIDEIKMESGKKL